MCFYFIKLQWLIVLFAINVIEMRPRMVEVLGTTLPPGFVIRKGIGIFKGPVGVEGTIKAS